MADVDAHKQWKLLETISQICALSHAQPAHSDIHRHRVLDLLDAFNQLDPSKALRTKWPYSTSNHSVVEHQTIEELKKTLTEYEELETLSESTLRVLQQELEDRQKLKVHSKTFGDISVNPTQTAAQKCNEAEKNIVTLESQLSRLVERLAEASILAERTSLTPLQRYFIPDTTTDTDTIKRNADEKAAQLKSTLQEAVRSSVLDPKTSKSTFPGQDEAILDLLKRAEIIDDVA